MAETIGFLIVDAVLSVSPELGTSLVAFAEGSVLGVSGGTLIGSAVIIGASIGLQYALAPKPPKPENGTQPIKQAVPPRIRGYGQNRLAGYYMLYEEAGKISYDVTAIHSGRIGEISKFYLHDDEISITNQGSFYGVDDTFEDGRYTDPSRGGAATIFLDYRLGTNSQTAPWFIGNDSGISALWNSEFKGNGVAWVALECDPVKIEDFTKTYPRNLPVLSVVAQCSPVWDPRNPLHDRNDESTWEVSYNPVVQLIDYLTRADGGMGLDYETIIEPRIMEWIAEADLCDELVDKADGTQEPRYQSHGWFQFDNNPEDIINGILSTCDGWMCEDVDGTLALKIGVYREPDGDAISGKQILGFTNIQFGQADESMVNQVDFTFTDPEQAFATSQPAPYRDEDAISASGVVRSKQLDLKWVQSAGQASRLAARSLLRINPAISATIITDLTALDWAGERWVPVQYPFIAGLEDCVMENQGAEIDLAAGRISFTFNLVVPTKVEDYNPDTDEKPAPPAPPTLSGYLAREDSAAMIREDNSVMFREDA